MAKLKKGILGPVSGTVGPVTFGTWLGISYVKKKKVKGKRSAPRSEGQVANQEKMKFLNIQLMPFHPYVDIGFKNLAIQKTALSAAYSFNFHNAIRGVHPNLSLDYSKMVISLGDLPGLVNPQITLIEPDKLKIDWEDNPHPLAEYDDLLMLVLYSPDLHKSDGFIGGIKRNAKTTVYTFHPSLIGKSLEVYIGLVSSNGKKIGNSVYMGRV